MRTSIRWLCLLLPLACQHARTTDTQRDASPDAKSGSDSAKSSGGAAASEGSRSGKSALPDESGRIAEPGHPILSVSAQGLRKPGGTEKLAQALNKAGCLDDPSTTNEENLRQALIRFQGKKDLAKTGFADHETLRQLGLDPNDIDLSQMPRTAPAP